MFDILPYPNITATEPVEQIGQINNYLIQLKEELEFALANIGTDNLSADLMTKLDSIGVDIKNTHEEIEQTQQIANHSLKLPDVIDSQMFKDETVKGVKVNGVEIEKDAENMVDLQMPTITFSIDFTTGDLTYTTS